MTDPRIAVLSALSSPGWHPVPEAHGMPWDEAVALLDAYDASRAAEPTVAPSAPADRTALRDRIAKALYAHDHPGHLVPLNETGMEPAYRESAVAVLAVLPEPADRAAILREAADAVRDGDLGPRGGMSRDYENGWWNSRAAAEDRVRRMADEAQQPETQGAADPVYDPRAWETYRRNAGCGCTAPAPVDCKIPHGTGAWLCPCHRLSGPPWKDGDPSGKPLSPEDASIRQHFQEPNRCLSANGIFRCSRPTGHPGDHRTGRTFWGRRAEDEQPAAVSQPDDEPPAPLRRSADDCPGFPERCPNLLPVDPNPPAHLGGIRCGCADKEPTS